MWKISMKVRASSSPSFSSTKICCWSQAARLLNLLGWEHLKINGGKCHIGMTFWWKHSTFETWSSRQHMSHGELTGKHLKASLLDEGRFPFFLLLIEEFHYCLKINILMAREFEGLLCMYRQNLTVVVSRTQSVSWKL